MQPSTSLKKKNDQPLGISEIQSFSKENTKKILNRNEGRWLILQILKMMNPYLGRNKVTKWLTIESRISSLLVAEYSGSEGTNLD